jgi:hypothetical protein
MHSRSETDVKIMFNLPHALSRPGAIDAVTATTKLLKRKGLHKIIILNAKLNWFMRLIDERGCVLEC